MPSLLCCISPQKTHSTDLDHKPVRKRSSRRSRKGHRDTLHANGHQSGGHQGHHTGNGTADEWPDKSMPSVAGSEDYCSCRDDFSTTDGAHLTEFHSPPNSPGVSSPGGHFTLHPTSANGFGKAHEVEVDDEDGVDASEGASESDSEFGNRQDSSKVGFVGCLHILDNLNLGSSKQASDPNTPSHRHHHSGNHIGHRSAKRHDKPEAGCSMQPRDMSQSAVDVSFCHEDASTSVFNIRSMDYMRTKVKQPSSPALYQLVTADVFAFSKKQSHIADLVQLPSVGPPVMAGDVSLPPLLIFNLQLPLYPANMFGPYDGEGVSIVFYFKLPDGFNPATFENQKALALYKRFVANGKEADGQPTRSRLKLIPRVVNVEEWTVKGPLSQAEHKVLSTYNDKPILTRPQHEFFQCSKYLEVDLDLHQYAYLARRAITSYLSRLKHVVWENAFVVQGNATDELPEHVLGSGRIYRVDFTQAKQLPSSSRGSTATGGGGDAV